MATGSSAERDKKFESASTLHSSQNSEIQHIQALFAKRKWKAQQRVRESQTRIAAQHGACIGSLSSQRDQAANCYHRNVDDITRPKLKRLVQLLNKRLALEGEADRCEEGIESAHLSTTQKILNAIERRRKVAALERKC